MHNSSSMSFGDSNSWNILSAIEISIKQKIEAVGVPLKDWNISISRGIITGFNEAFIITGEKKDELIAADPKSAEIIRPILRGRDIKRYSYKFADLWVILAGYGSHEYLEREYPAVYAHLFEYKEQLKKRGQCKYTSSGKVNKEKPYPGQHHWLELDNNPRKEYLDDFSKPKIVWGNLCLSAQFALVENCIFVSAPSPMIVPGNKFILAVLNSKVGDWYIRQLGVTRNGGYFEYKPMFIEKLPIPQLSEEQQVAFAKAVDALQEAKQRAIDLTPYEAEIDRMVFKLYSLSNEEIKYINEG